MRICHVSDTHGIFTPLKGKFDFVVHSGDLFPNSHHVFSNREREMAFQYQWLIDNVHNFKEWLKGYPLLYVPGNHDFLDDEMLAQILNSENITAINLTNKMVNFNDINFYGFPYVGFNSGFWNYEKTHDEMLILVNGMLSNIKKSYDNNQVLDVIVAHCPLYKVLDKTHWGDYIGNIELTDALKYFPQEMMPSHYLCGHCHEAAGTARSAFSKSLDKNESVTMLVSNAATIQNIISL